MLERLADRLYALPDLAIAALFAICVLVPCAAMPFIANRYFGLKPDKDRADFALRAHATAITSLAFVIAFSLVQAQGNLRQAAEAVGAEASQLNQLDRVLARYGDAKTIPIREALLAYGQSIVKDEWPLLKEGQASTRTGEMFRPVTRGILALDPAPGRQTLIFAEMLKSIDQISDSRAVRLDAANLALPMTFWQIIIAFIVLLMVFAGFTEPTSRHALALGGQGVMIGLLIALVFIFDEPFKGQTSVEPTAIAKVLDTMSRRNAS